MKHMSKLVWLAAIASTLPLLANAHYIWIERDAKGNNGEARLYFKK